MKIRPGQIAEDGANTGEPGTPGGGATVVTRDRLTASAGDDTLTLGGSQKDPIIVPSSLLNSAGSNYIAFKVDDDNADPLGDVCFADLRVEGVLP